MVRPDMARNGKNVRCALAFPSTKRKTRDEIQRDT